MSAPERILGAAPVAATWRRLRSGLRVLAYHGVPDADAFDRQLEHLVAAYHTVGADDVAATTRGGDALPPRAVWVTFDDGSPDVLEGGLAMLRRHAVPATLFVCPGLIGTDTPFWWQTVDRAVASGAAADVGFDTAARGRLKRCPDAERRATVSQLEDELRRRGRDTRSRQLGWDDLDRWVDAGHTVGNHTWDHPCLDRCEDEVQRAQIEDADAALAPYIGGARTFAYPNGNWSPVAETTLRRLGYDVGLVFDHRIARPATNPLRMSRLRIDSDAPRARFRAVVAGTHSAAFALLPRARNGTVA
jgi:peptidoglycan/xylan/chitin deacetylase (PgdA/CDA1 family)